MRTFLLAAAFVVAACSSARAVVIDSYDVPLPPHPLLASGRSILFLGPACDGTLCPPDPTVVNEEGRDEIDQVGVPGTPSGHRFTHFNSLGKDVSLDRAQIEVSGGSLHLADPGSNGLEVITLWGWRDYPLALDLVAEGSDRFELDVVSEAGSFTPFTIEFFFKSIYGDGGAGSSENTASQRLQVSAPGTIVFPYANFANVSGSFPASLQKVDQAGFWILDFPAGDAVRIEEVRTASTPTPARATSWGRVKAGYR